MPAILTPNAKPKIWEITDMTKLDLSKTYRTRDGSARGLKVERCGALLKIVGLLSYRLLDGRMEQNTETHLDLISEETEALSAGPVDISKIRPGDKGTISVVFGEVSPSGWVELMPLRHENYGDETPPKIWTEADRIISHTPALKKDDMVTLVGSDAGIIYKVLGFDPEAGNVWLSHSKRPVGSKNVGIVVSQESIKLA